MIQIRNCLVYENYHGWEIYSDGSARFISNPIFNFKGEEIDRLAESDQLLDSFQRWYPDSPINEIKDILKEAKSIKIYFEETCNFWEDAEEWYRASVLEEAAISTYRFLEGKKSKECLLEYLQRAEEKNLILLLGELMRKEGLPIFDPFQILISAVEIIAVQGAMAHGSHSLLLEKCYKLRKEL